MRKYPIGNPYNHSIRYKSPQTCDYCHKNPIMYIVAGKQRNRFDYICRQCYEYQQGLKEDQK